MSAPSEIVTPALLREWALPDPGGSKYGRGQVLVVGGAAKTPGAAMLPGLAALRVGAGHLQLAVARSAAVPIAVAIPESGVIGLPEVAGGSVSGDSAGQLADALSGVDTVLVGSGLDDADEAAALLRGLTPLVDDETTVVLDAYALGVLLDLDEVRSALAGRLVLTPNSNEASRLLGGEPDDVADGVSEIARRYEAVVSSSGFVQTPRGGGGRSPPAMSGWRRRGAATYWRGVWPACSRGALTRRRRRAGPRICMPRPVTGSPAGWAARVPRP